MTADTPTPAETPGERDCPTCSGNGEVVTSWDDYLHPPPGASADAGTADCPDCDGIGKIATPPSGGSDHAGPAQADPASSAAPADTVSGMEEEKPPSWWAGAGAMAAYESRQARHAASSKDQGSDLGLREALDEANERTDTLMVDKAWLIHCLAINVEPVVRQCVTGVVGLDGPTTETLVEHLTARLHAAIRPQSLKDSLAALSPEGGKA